MRRLWNAVVQWKRFYCAFGQPVAAFRHARDVYRGNVYEG